MNKLRSFGAACALTLVFSMPAFAGYIQTGVAAPQPSPSPAVAVTASTTEAAGSVTGNSQTNIMPADTLTGVALNLVVSLLSLL